MSVAGFISRTTAIGSKPPPTWVLHRFRRICLFMRFSKLYLLMALVTCGHALAADLTLTRWAPNLNAEALAFLPNGPERLAASTREGLLLLDDKGAELARFKGNFSSLDSRAAGAQVLVATLDNQRQQAMLISLDSAGKRWGAPLYLPTRDYPVNGLCLYRDSAANLFVFLVGEEGKGEQWLVGNGPTLLAQPQRVRGLPLPPSAQFCQVDDAANQLLVNEQNVGWWAYPAHPEAEVKRTPVALFDNPTRAAGAMALVPGGVVALDPKTAQLQLFQQEGERWVAQSSLRLPGVTEPENLAIKGRQLLLRDDDTGNLYQAELTWQAKPVAPAPVLPEVAAQRQTDPVGRQGDAADDPAIWIHPEQPAQSRVLGTNKKQGLLAYDLDGKLLQELAVGRLNNVDVRPNFKLGQQTVDLAVASNRDHNSLSLFSI